MLEVNKITQKIQVAIRRIASVDCLNCEHGQRAVYKFGHFTKTQAATGRWNPGMLTKPLKNMLTPDYSLLLIQELIAIPY